MSTETLRMPALNRRGQHGWYAMAERRNGRAVGTLYRGLASVRGGSLTPQQDFDVPVQPDGRFEVGVGSSGARVFFRWPQTSMANAYEAARRTP